MNTAKVQLNNGVMMPIEGFGVFQIPYAAQCLDAVGYALKAGYRLIDTASVYDNERAVGKAIKDSDINRSEIFLTTKVWTSQMGYDRTMKAFENSLKRLGQDYTLFTCLTEMSPELGVRWNDFTMKDESAVSESAIFPGHISQIFVFHRKSNLW